MKHTIHITLVIILFLIGCSQPVFGQGARNDQRITFEQLTTKRGRTYEDVNVTRIDGNWVYFYYENGSTRLSREELPDSVVEKLGMPTMTMEEVARQKWMEKVTRQKWMEKVARQKWMEEVARQKWMEEVARQKWMEERMEEVVRLKGVYRGQQRTFSVYMSFHSNLADAGAAIGLSADTVAGIGSWKTGIVESNGLFTATKVTLD